MHVELAPVLDVQRFRLEPRRVATKRKGSDLAAEAFDVAFVLAVFGIGKAGLSDVDPLVEIFDLRLQRLVLLLRIRVFSERRGRNEQRQDEEETNRVNDWEVDFIVAAFQKVVIKNRSTRSSVFVRPRGDTVISREPLAQIGPFATRIPLAGSLESFYEILQQARVNSLERIDLVRAIFGNA